jgi:hypothetical protein
MAASLALTQSTGLNCPKTAGVKALYIIPQSDVVTVAAGTSHDIVNLVFATAGAGFGKINFARGQAEVKEAMERSNEVEISFAVPNPTTVQRKELEAIKNMCEMYVVAELYDNETLLFIGWDAKAEDEAFVKFKSLESTSGKAKTDDNLFNFILMAEHSEILRHLTSITGASGGSATTKTAILAELLAATSV